MMRFKAYASSSRANAYTVSDGQQTILIEMGLPIRELKKALGFGLSEVSFALLTHCHQDHCRAVSEVMKAGVDVYTSQGTIDFLGLTGHRIHAVAAQEQFGVNGWQIVPVEAQHDAPEPLSYYIVNPAGERMLFATDTFYLKNRFANMNLIAVECNYAADILQANVDAGTIDHMLRNRLLKSHFSLENVKEFLKANDLSRVEEIHLLHLSDSNSDAARFKTEIQALTGKPTFIAGG